MRCQGFPVVRQAARRDRRVKFTSLLYHLTVELLHESFYNLKRDAARGVEERIVQTAVVQVLNAIYEQNFSRCLVWFSPKSRATRCIGCVIGRNTELACSLDIRCGYSSGL